VNKHQKREVPESLYNNLEPKGEEGPGLMTLPNGCKGLANVCGSPSMSSCRPFFFEEGLQTLFLKRVSDSGKPERPYGIVRERFDKP
jgi:hypothetical protein